MSVYQVQVVLSSVFFSLSSRLSPSWFHIVFCFNFLPLLRSLAPLPSFCFIAFPFPSYLFLSPSFYLLSHVSPFLSRYCLLLASFPASIFPIFSSSQSHLSSLWIFTLAYFPSSSATSCPLPFPHAAPYSRSLASSSCSSHASTTLPPLPSLHAYGDGRRLRGWVNNINKPSTAYAELNTLLKRPPWLSVGSESAGKNNNNNGNFRRWCHTLSSPRCFLVLDSFVVSLSRFRLVICRLLSVVYLFIHLYLLVYSFTWSLYLLFCFCSFIHLFI